MWPFKRKKKSPPAPLFFKNLYKIVEETEEFDELEGTIWLHLIDGTEVTFKKLGHIRQHCFDRYSLVTGEALSYKDYDKFPSENIAYFYRFVDYLRPSMYEVDYQGIKSIVYENASGVKVEINQSMILQHSIDIKPTGKKVTGTKGKIVKIEEGL